MREADVNNTTETGVKSVDETAIRQAAIDAMRKHLSPGNMDGIGYALAEAVAAAVLAVEASRE